MELIKTAIKKIEKALPLQIVAVNVMRHFLKIIREEYDNGLKVLLLLLYLLFVT